MKIFIQYLSYHYLGVKRRTLLSFFVTMLLAGFAQAQVNGTVFQDFNANGKRTSGTDTLEIGVPNIKVRLFVGNSATQIEKLTDKKGYYAFSALEIPADSNFRIEFANIPAFWTDSPVGDDSRTSVLFGKAPQVKFDFGISNDEDFCYGGDDTKVITSCFANGAAIGGSAGEEPAIVMFGYNVNGKAGIDFPVTKLAKIKQVGAVWPATYQKLKKQVVVAPIVRRHAGLGSLGTSGLYAISGGVTDTLIDFKKRYGIDFGDDPHVGLDPDMLKPNHDSATIHHVGKRAFGGLQFSRYQDSLLFINLFDKKLYIILLEANGAFPTDKNKVQSFSIPDPGCSNGDYRPWALKYHRGEYYVGVVCSGETSQNKDDLKFTVYRFSPNTGTFTNLITEPLTYKRDPLDATTPYCFTYDRWLPWNAEWPQVCSLEPRVARPGGPNFIMNPQPILSDIEFDVNGTMILGFMDRFGLQAGLDNYGPTAADTMKYVSFMSGDLLRVHLENGVYKLEQNGKSGDLTGCGINKGAGPGGGEFYCDDEWFLNNTATVPAHAETANGGVNFVPGTNEIFATVMDPINGVFASAGYRVFDNKTGKVKRAISLYDLKPGSFGKSGGIGDVVSLCDPASIQIGNRIWFDKNRNGVQEGNEAGLDGIIVKLFDPQTDTLVATDTTKNAGQFYFGSSNVLGGLKPLRNYEIRVDMTQPGLGNPYPGNTPVGSPNILNLSLRTAALGDSLSTQYDLSPANINTFSDPQIRDSDASYTNGKNGLVIALKTKNFGTNDFTQDIGLMAKKAEVLDFDLELKKVLIGDCKKQIGDTVTFQIVLSNVGDRLSVADSVFVADTLVNNLTFISAITTSGNFNNTTHLWGPLKLAGGKSDTLTIKAKINANNGFEGGAIVNTAEVKSYKGIDIDSKPGNGVRTEDDFGLALASVPTKICPQRGDTLIIAAPPGYTKYQWFMGNMKIEGATKATLEVAAAGEYRVEVELNGCPSQNCCPAIVTEDCPCPPDICVPFVIRKTKSKNKPIVRPQ